MVVFMVKIGILDLQGAVSEHYHITKKAVERLGLEVEVESLFVFNSFRIIKFERLFITALLCPNIE